MRSLLGSTLQTITSKALLVTVIKATTVMANVITEPALCLVQKGSCKNAVMSLVLFLAIVMGMQHPRKDHQEIMEYALEQVRQMGTTHYSDNFLEPKLFPHIHPFGLGGWYSGCSKDFSDHVKMTLYDERSWLARDPLPLL